MLFDGEAVQFRRVEYDIQTTVRKIRDIDDLDDFLGDRLWGLSKHSMPCGRSGTPPLLRNCLSLSKHTRRKADDRPSWPGSKMRRVHQIALITSLLIASWLGMQAVHEFGHVLGAWLTGGRVTQVVLHPLTISRTDLADNPNPLLVVWAGPVAGCVLPLAAWGIAHFVGFPLLYLLRFFAGFCLIANGAYIGVGSFDNVGDAGVMVRHGSPEWSLWAFGVVTIPLGVWLWHRQGRHFGLGPQQESVHPSAVYLCVTVLVALLILGVVVDGH